MFVSGLGRCLFLFFNKEAFSKAEDYRHKVQALTLVPDEVSNLKLAELFGTTKYLIQKGKNLYEAEGALAIPEKIIRKRFSDEDEDKVRLFIEITRLILLIGNFILIFKYRSLNFS